MRRADDIPAKAAHSPVDYIVCVTDNGKRLLCKRL